MRLTCPNCGAQYEVDAGMIPDDGRDVQCSNCGQTWFQMPEGQMSVPDATEVADAPAEAASPAEEEPPVAEPVTEPADEVSADDHEAEDTLAESETPDAEAADSPEQDDAQPADDNDDAPAAEDAQAASPLEEAMRAQKAALDDEMHAGDAEPSEELATEPTDTAEEDEAPEPPTEDAPPRREVDAAVLGILREEADREVAARRQERGEALEMQTEMGLTDAAPPPPTETETETETETPDTETLISRTLQDEFDETGDAPGSRSDLLPDVEEINSSLRPADQHEDGVGADDPVAQEVNKRRGFRTGFIAIVAIAAVLVLAYIFAGQIVQAVPAAEPVVIIYLDVADSARAGLDSAMARSVEGLSGLLANMSGDEAN